MFPGRGQGWLPPPVSSPSRHLLSLAQHWPPDFRPSPDPQAPASPQASGKSPVVNNTLLNPGRRGSPARGGTESRSAASSPLAARSLQSHISNVWAYQPPCTPWPSPFITPGWSWAGSLLGPLTMGFLNSLGLIQRTKKGWQAPSVRISSSSDRLNWLLSVGERFLVSAPWGDGPQRWEGLTCAPPHSRKGSWRGGQWGQGLRENCPGK